MAFRRNAKVPSDWGGIVSAEEELALELPSEGDVVWSQEAPSFARKMVDENTSLYLRRIRTYELLDIELKASLEKNGFAPEKFGRVVYK